MIRVLLEQESCLHYVSLLIKGIDNQNKSSVDALISTTKADDLWDAVS